MNGFIDVKERDSGMCVLCPIDRILAIVEEEDGGAYIETNFDKCGKRADSTGIYTVDSITEIKIKIVQSEG